MRLSGTLDPDFFVLNFRFASVVLSCLGGTQRFSKFTTLAKLALNLGVSLVIERTRAQH